MKGRGKSRAEKHVCPSNYHSRAIYTHINLSDLIISVSPAVVGAFPDLKNLLFADLNSIIENEMRYIKDFRSSESAKVDLRQG